MKTIVILMLSLYKILISPILEQLGLGKCRYEETCSMYMMRQVEEKGARKGIMLGLKRLSTCHPFAKPWEEKV